MLLKEKAKQEANK
jgi:integrase